MKPGMYGQLWGDITVWPVAETFYFTADDGYEGNEGSSSRYGY